MFLLYYVNCWDYTNYYIRFIYLGLVILGVLSSYMQFVINGLHIESKIEKITILLIVFFCYNLIKIINLRLKNNKSIDLKFPFNNRHN